MAVLFFRKGMRPVLGHNVGAGDIVVMDVRQHRSGGPYEVYAIGAHGEMDYLADRAGGATFGSKSEALQYARFVEGQWRLSHPDYREPYYQTKRDWEEYGVPWQRNPLRKGLKSRKALWKSLSVLKAALPGIKLPARAEDMNNEIYGRRADIYIDVDSLQTRLTLERALEWLGYKVNREYGSGPGHPPLNVVDVQVAWFKGYHWDE